MADQLASLRDIPALSRIRRNHGLEHATIHILSQQFPAHRFMGRSTTRGFYLYGDVSTETLESVVSEALLRLQKGEQDLAIHPNCGTNLVTSAILAGVASFFTLSGSAGDTWRRRLERLPLVIATILLALIVSQPLGLSVQQHITTQGDPGLLQILSVQRILTTSSQLHFIETTD